MDAHPELLDRAAPSLRSRLGITEDAVPDLAEAAAARAIADWGRPAADITHLVVNTNLSAGSPGADLRLATRLGLRPTAQRTLLCLHGCAGGSVALRLAKDLAENGPGARVLVVCAEAIALAFGPPDAACPDTLVAMGLFGDGAGAAVVGAGPVGCVERPVFRMVHASQATLPETEHAVGLKVSEGGLDFYISVELPKLVGKNIERCLADTLAPFGLSSCWNGLFWAVHPGGRAILDSYQAALGLEPRKLAPSRRVLSEYGNMLGATIFFVLHEMRCRRRNGNDEERDKCDWGVMLGLGPGITIETMVLHAAGMGDDDH
jgi:bisdemethoxycurcumin synthase